MFDYPEEFSHFIIFIWRCDTSCPISSPQRFHDRTIGVEFGRFETIAIPSTQKRKAAFTAILTKSLHISK
jgi:hypothetical protein